MPLGGGERDCQQSQILNVYHGHGHGHDHGHGHGHGEFKLLPVRKPFRNKRPRGPESLLLDIRLSRLHLELPYMQNVLAP